MKAGTTLFQAYFDKEVFSNICNIFSYLPQLVLEFSWFAYLHEDYVWVEKF